MLLAKESQIFFVAHGILFGVYTCLMWILVSGQFTLLHVVI